jgi:glycosyltransferase involved in cell wall biosynthesis
LSFQKMIKSQKICIIIDTVTAPGLYHIGDVYVYPSRLEGIGLTIAEALASGMPTIVPDEAPMNEYLCPNSTAVEVERRFTRYDGYYWESNEVSVNALSKTFTIYYESRHQVADMQRQTREYATSHLTWKSRVPLIANAFSKSKIIDCDTSNWKMYNNEFNTHFPYISQLQVLYKFIWLFAKSNFVKKFRV